MCVYTSLHTKKQNRENHTYDQLCYDDNAGRTMTI